MPFTVGQYLTKNDLDSQEKAHTLGYGVVNGLQVIPDAPPSMDIDVEVGKCYAADTVVVKGAVTTLAVGGADPANPRKDIVVCNSAGLLSIVAGTPEAALPGANVGVYTLNPEPPNIPANSIILAEIWVAAGATEITGAEIYDKRVFTVDRLGKARLEWAADKLLMGAGAGASPTEVAPSDIGVDYGLSFIGTVTGIDGAPKFQCSGLIGFGDNFFKNYWAYVVWDAAGAGGAPQGEKLVCSGYDSATGDFTVAAFSVPIAVDDKVLFMHPSAVQAKMLFSMDFWSVPLESITLTDIASPGTDVALPDVVVDIPAGATVVRAVAMFKFRMLDNPGAANALQGDQYIGIQKGGGGGYDNAIFLDDNMFGIAEATREGGDIVVGNLNVATKVDGDATYNLQWTASLVDVADLKFCDVQTGIRVWYSV